jgi:DNA-binding LacI/PurR family transcriptional regulator
VRGRYGLQVPQDLSIIGYDDIAQAGWAFAELTTIRQSVEELARQAIDLLASRIEDPDADPRTAIVPVELVSRRTA